MDRTEEALKAETDKWLDRLKKETKGIRAKDVRAAAQLENMNAYIHDCGHFQKQGDWIRAFEACVYAWGILETLRHLDLIK